MFTLKITLFSSNENLDFLDNQEIQKKIKPLIFLFSPKN